MRFGQLVNRWLRHRSERYSCSLRAALREFSTNSAKMYTGRSDAFTGGPGERGRCQKIGRMDPISPMTELTEYSQEEGHVEMS